MKLTKQDLLAFGSILLLIVIIFRKFFFQGLLPIPYNILVGWYFPYNIGGWEGYAPGIFFKGGLYAADVFRQMVPWKMLAIEQIKLGQLPLWNPYNFSGEPLLANIQATIFYPLTLIFFLTDFHSAWSLYIILSPLLGALYMFLFLRSLKLSSFPSLIGSLAFALSGHMISWLQWGIVTHSAIWLPLILFSLNKIVVRKKRWALLTLILGTYATLLGGYPQESAYALLLAAAYAMFLIFEKSKSSTNSTKRPTQIYQYINTLLIFPRAFKQIVLYIFFPSLALSLIFFQLIPTFNLFNNSALKGAASEDLYLRTRLSPRHALTLFAPDYYGNRITNNYWANTFTKVDYMDANLFIGSVALLFALYSLIVPNKFPHHKFFLYSAFITFIFALKSPLTLAVATLQIPAVSTGVASGILYITTSSLAVLSAIGAQNWINKPRPKSLLKLLPIYALVLVTLIFVPPEFRKVSARNLVIPTAITTFSLTAMFVFSRSKSISLIPFLNKTQRLTLVSILLLISACAEYSIYANKILSFSPRKYAYPRHQLIYQLQQVSGFDRSMGFWDSEISNNFHTQFKLFGSEGYNPLHSRSYQELTASGETGQLPDTLFRSDADAAVKNETNRNRFIDLASVKYIAAKVTDPSDSWEQEPLKYNPERFQLLWQQGKFKIYQNLHALPRASLYNQYQAIADQQQRLKTIYSSDWNPHSSIIIESAPVQPISQTATGSAQIVSYTPNQVIINTNTTGGNSLLLLTDSYYPSWKAYIDNRQTNIVRANHAFRSLIIPEGKHKVEFKITWP